MEIAEAFTAEAIERTDTNVGGEQEDELRALIRQVYGVNGVENITQVHEDIGVHIFVAGRAYQAQSEPEFIIPISLAVPFMEYLAKKGEVMDLQEKMETISELMRTMKEDWVAQEPEQTDIGIYLHFYRGDEMVVAVACPLDRDTALQAAFLGSIGFCSDTTVITFESYHTELEVSPISKRRWVPGEMERLFFGDPDAVEKGWVHECVTTTAHERGGGYGLVSLPYLIKEGQVVWQDAVRPPSDGKPEGGGVMFDSLQHSMASPTLEDQIAKEPPDSIAAALSGLVTDPEQRAFHTDMATLKAMEERQLIVSAALTAEEGSERQRLLKERLDQPDET